MRRLLRHGGVYSLPDEREFVAGNSPRGGYYLYAHPAVCVCALPSYEVVPTGAIYQAGRATRWGVEDLRDTGETTRREC